MKKLVCSLSVILTMSFISCSDILLDKDPSNDPVTNFELLWKEFDEFYGEFEVKNINWDSLHKVYRAQVNANSSDHQLFLVLQNLLLNLNDSHVILASPQSDEPVFFSGSLHNRTREDFYLKTVTDHYVINSQKKGAMTYGRITDDIGYIHIASFDDSQQFFIDALDAILDDLDGVTKMVIDIRDNDGGNDATGQVVANRFTTSKNKYMSTSRKSGPAHNNFASPIDWYVSPHGRHFSGAIALLTNRWTISTAETFAFAMRVNPNVVQIGDTTTGAFSDTRNFMLPNGFYTRIPESDVRFADGRSYEGIGIAPHLTIINQKEDLLNGKDEVLDHAIGVLQ